MKKRRDYIGYTQTLLSLPLLLLLLLFMFYYFLVTGVCYFPPIYWRLFAFFLLLLAVFGATVVAAGVALFFIQLPLSLPATVSEDSRARALRLPTKMMIIIINSFVFN